YDGAVAQMQQVNGPAAAFNNLGVILLIYVKDPSAAIKAFEQALRYDPAYDKARANLATARSLVPAPTGVHLPPHPRVNVPDRSEVSVDVDMTDAVVPAGEQSMHFQSDTVSHPAEPSPMKHTQKPTRFNPEQVSAVAPVLHAAQPFKGVRHVDRP